MEIFKNIEKSLGFIRTIYSNYLIINILSNDKFEMFESDIYILAKYLNINVEEGKNKYVFDNCNEIILRLQKSNDFNVVIIKDKKLYLKIEYLTEKQKEEKRKSKKNDVKIIKENFDKPSVLIVKKRKKNMDVINNNDESINLKEEYYKKKLEEPEDMPKLTKGIVARCYKCKNNVSEFYEFNSGKCLCENCVNNLSKDDLIKEIKLKYSKIYENKSKIFRKVYLGGFS